MPSDSSRLRDDDARVRELVIRAGASRIAAIERMAGGRNNRAYRVDTPERVFFLKAYHSDPNDPRSRLRAEFAFLRFAWDQGIRCVPEPLADDEKNNLGLYGFVEGRRLGADEIARDHIGQAGRFVEELNRRRDAAASLPPAAEACFSFEAHLDLVDARVRRLAAIDGSGEIGEGAKTLVGERLLPRWQALSRRVRRLAAEEGLLGAGELAAHERCLSPSDFGFHNAIAEPSGRLVFHDFEYAGWDDAAKLVCDFLCQPEVPVPDELAEVAYEKLLPSLGRPGLRRQIELLQPVYRLKWASICLNEFLPEGGRRRRFAAGLGEKEKAAQLAKARRLLESVTVL